MVVNDFKIGGALLIPKEWVTTPTDRESRGVMTPSATGGS